MSRLTLLSTSSPCQQIQNDTFCMCCGWFPHCKLATFPLHGIWCSAFKAQLFSSDGSSVLNSLISTRLEQMKSISSILVTDEVLTANHHKICNDALFHGDLPHLVKELKGKLINPLVHFFSPQIHWKHSEAQAPLVSSTRRQLCMCCPALVQLVPICHSAMHTLFATGFQSY